MRTTYSQLFPISRASKAYLTYPLRKKVSIFGVFLVRIQSKYGKIRTRKTPNTDTFYARTISTNFDNNVADLLP